VYGLAPYCLAGRGRAALLFGYGTLSERAIVEGVEALADAIADVRSHAGGPHTADTLS
jgi:GntR family transcriptional regulator/MocR family aminotransferase